MGCLRKGFIYLITNNVNQKKYVGQTARDIDTRFSEHCAEKRGYSRLHNAIQKYGWQNFKVEQLEQVSLDQLDEREKYWIKEMGTRNPEVGYNIALGGKSNFNSYNKIEVVENGLIFDSQEEMSRVIQKVTSWNKRFIASTIHQALEQNKTFLKYHLVVRPPETIPSDDDVLVDWAKTLNIKYQGKHIYCEELDLEFETIGQAAQYLIENNLYATRSKTPIQSVISSISQNIHGKSEYINGVQAALHFQEVPGATTKQPGYKDKEKLFQKKTIYCPEIDRTFIGIEEAAKYFLNNGIWKNIKIKTAKLRISDVIRGVFQDYKGYSFKEVE